MYVPGPPCFPLVGSVLFLPRKYPYIIMAGNWLEKYGPVVGLLFGSKKAVAVSGANAVLEVLRREEFQGRIESSRLKDMSFNQRLGKWHSKWIYVIYIAFDFRNFSGFFYYLTKPIKLQGLNNVEWGEEIVINIEWITTWQEVHYYKSIPGFPTKIMIHVVVSRVRKIAKNDS